MIYKVNSTRSRETTTGLSTSRIVGMLCLTSLIIDNYYAVELLFIFIFNILTNVYNDDDEDFQDQDSIPRMT